MSENTDPKNKKVASSYDDKMSKEKTKPTWESINKQIEENPIPQSFEAFNTSKNTDYLQGWENPHTYAGGFNTDVADPFEEIRATNQSFINKLGKAPLRVSTKVATEILKIPGYIGGLAGGLGGEVSDLVTGKDEYSFTEQAFDNGWVKAMENINQNINQDMLPVYVKDSVQKGSLWDNVSSVDFWATEGADGIGFMASMMVPGTILKSLGLGSKMMNATSKLASLSKEGSRLANVARKVSDIGLTAEKFNVFNATMANTYLEAAAEAGGAMENFSKGEMNSLIDEGLASGLSYEDSVKKAEEQKAILGRDTFTANAVLLLGPNALQSSMMFGKGASKLLNSYTTKEAVMAGTKRVANNFIAEGFVEEAGQSTVESYLSGKAAKGQLKESMSSNFDANGLKEAYINTLTSVDGQKAIFLGGALGSSMSIYQGRKEDIASKKATDRVNLLTNRYDSTLRSLIETDNQKKDKQGNPVFDTAGKPVIDNRVVVEKLKTIDNLSARFDEYDSALKSGDNESLDKARNKTIQDITLPFVKEGEAGIEKLEQYYDSMLQSEEVMASEDYENIKSRKEEVLKTAKEVSKKYESYSSFANSYFDIKIEAKGKEEVAALNAAKREYFNSVSSSYAMAETERSQVKNKIKDLTKQINSIEEIHNVNRVTIDEANATGFEIDYEKNIINKNKEALANKDKVYKELIDYKARLENKFTEVEKEIADQFFNSEKVNEDFQNKYSSKLESVEDKKVFTEPTQTEDEVLDEQFKQVTADDVVADLGEQLNNNSIATKEDFDDYIESVDPEYREAVRLMYSEEYDALPVNEEVEDEQRFTENEIVGGEKEVNEKEGELAESTLEDIYVKDEILDVEAENETNQAEGGKIRGHMLMSLNNKFQPIFDALKDFVKYEKEPRNKLNDKVVFNLGDLSKIDNDYLKSKYPSISLDAVMKKVKAGTVLTYSEVTALQLFLPITTTLSNDKSSASSFLKGLTSKLNREIFDKEQLPLRVNIITQLIKHKGDFNSFEGRVKFQGKGKLELSNRSDNNVLELSVFEGMTDDQKVKYIQKNSYYVNWAYDLVKADKGVSNEKSFKHTIKSFYPGDVFLTIKRPNGDLFPLRLNNNRLSDSKADAMVKLTSLYSSVLKKNLDVVDVDLFLKEGLGEAAYNELSSEISLANKMDIPNKSKIAELINLVIYTQNNNERSKFFIKDNGDLILGSLVHKVNEQLQENESQVYESELSEVGFTGYRFSTLENLNKPVEEMTSTEKLAYDALHTYLKYKKTNIQSQFNNVNYVKHVFGMNGNEASVTTNAVVNQELFSGYSNIILDNNTVDSEVGRAQMTAAMESAVIPDDVVQQYIAPLSMNEEVTEIEKRREEEVRFASKEVYETGFYKEKEYKGGWIEVEAELNAKYDAELNSLNSEKELFDLSDDNMSLEEKKDNLEREYNDLKIINPDLGTPEKERMNEIQKEIRKLNPQIALSNKNNLKEIRNSQENVVSLQKDLNTTKTLSKKEMYQVIKKAKETLGFVSLEQHIDSIEDQYKHLLEEYKNEIDKLTEIVDSVCKN